MSASPRTKGAVVYVLSCDDFQRATITRERIANTVHCVLCDARMFIVRVIYGDYTVTELQMYSGLP